MAVSVRWASLTAGSAKALMPLLTASTPVIAVQPLANARKSSQRPTASAAFGKAGGGVTGTGWPPLPTVPINPQRRTRPKLPMKR